MKTTKTTISQTVNCDGKVIFEGRYGGQKPPAPASGTPANSLTIDWDTLNIWCWDPDSDDWALCGGE